MDKEEYGNHIDIWYMLKDLGLKHERIRHGLGICPDWRIGFKWEPDDIGSNVKRVQDAFDSAGIVYNNIKYRELVWFCIEWPQTYTVP